MEENFINNNSVDIIAEIGNSHEGSFKAIKEVTKQVAEAGLKIIKYQKYYADELYINTHSRYEHFKQMEFKFEEWQELISLAKNFNLLVFCDCFGIKSAQELIDLDIDGYKIHSSDLANFALIRLLAATGKPILLSCGGATLIEIHEAVEEIKKAGNKNIVLMHGFQGFPTDIKDTNLNRIDFLHKTFNLPVGFADHVDAGSKVAYIIPLLSILKKVRFIEKHITLDRSKKGIDYNSSLEPQELKKLNSLLPGTQIALGDPSNTWSLNEREYRRKMKKILIASCDLKVGDTLTEQNTVLKRLNINDDTFSLNQKDILGKKVIQYILKDEIIKNNKLENKIGILIAVRTNSKRLPGKALLEICNKKTIEHLIERAKLSKRSDVICLCTSTDPEDDILVNIAKNYGIEWFRGSKDNVLERFIGAIDRENLDVVVRVTGDDILLDPEHLDKTVDYSLKTNAQYSNNKKLPSGTECEVFLASTLKKIYTYAEDSSQTEYLTNYIFDNQFNKNEYPVDEKYSKRYRLTLDTIEDYKVIKTILENIYSSSKPYTLDDLLSHIKQHPELLKINDKLPSNESTNLKINTKLSFV